MHPHFFPTPAAEERRIRVACQGVLPLTARLEPWMLELLSRGPLDQWVQRFGSPLNVLCTDPMVQNLRQLNATALERGLDFRVYFARKANKCLRLIDAVAANDAGIDTASLTELQQVLDRGFPADRVICTAAIKNEHLITTCLAHNVTIAIDNADELQTLIEIAGSADHRPAIALRISGFRDQFSNHKLHSRFGIDIDELPSLTNHYWSPENRRGPTIAGLHFHLDGHSVSQRVDAITQLLPWIDHLRSIGQPVEFLDIGGGCPASYLTSQQQWDDFWREHDLALLGERPPITYRNHGLGRTALEGKVHGVANVYPFVKGPVQADWLARILDTWVESRSLAASITQRNLQLRCEPGRSLLDGCGMTVARVEHQKRHPEGYWLVGLSMNRTQCRTTDDDFLVDPILLRKNPPPRPQRLNDAGFLVGAYCTEHELISLRRLRFPHGVARGDLFVFPNTAGYWMHFMESRSHQFPLAQNLFVSQQPVGFQISLDE